MRFGYMVALILIVGAVFATVVTHDFLVWDDDVFLFRNPLLQPPSWAHLAQVWREPYAHLYAPVTYSAWILLGMAASVNVRGQAVLTPAVFHAASVLVHILSALAVFALLRLLLGREGNGAVARAAFIGALVFALHPLQVEAVAWASELKDLLSGLFGLVALVLYLAPEPAHRGAMRARGLYIAATVAFILALLSKPNVAVLPLLAGLLDWYLQRRTLRQSLTLLLPWVALAGLLAVLTRHAQPPSAELYVPPLLRPLIMGDALAFYLGKLVWPLRLAADYGRTPQWVLAQPATRFIWLLPAAALVLTWLARRRWPALTVGVWLFCLAPLASLGVVAFDFQQYSTVADHYIYLGLLGPALLAAWLAHRGPRLGTAAGAALVLGALAALTLLQLMIWSNSTAFWQHTLVVNPRSLVAHNNLAAGYMMGQRPDLAEEHLVAAVALKPDDADALINLGMARLQQRRFQEAIEPLKQGLQSRPGDSKAILLLGMSLVEAGRPEEALPYLLQTLESNPEDPNTRFTLARALLKLGRQAEARAHLEALQRDNPGSGQVEELLKQSR
jgi:tetratricopeptide (TPR) repeat protein